MARTAYPTTLINNLNKKLAKRKEKEEAPNITESDIGKMKQYHITLNGLTPLIMHGMNLTFTEKLNAWRLDENNQAQAVKGDDRSPAWSWIGNMYHDEEVVGMPSDNLMTMLREGGTKIIKSGKETFKRQTQSGIIIDQQQWVLIGPKGTISVKPFYKLIEENKPFNEHLTLTEEHGFELLVKRAKIGQAKHVRVRPMFRNWTLEGSLTVIDEEMFGLTSNIINRIFTIAGALVGLGDWRPSSPSAPGTFGKFKATIKQIN